MVEQCLVFYRRDHMDSGEEFSILMVHLLLPPFRDYSEHLISHQNVTSFSWDSLELQTRTLGVFCSPSLLNHHLGMAVARLPPGAPQVLLAWCGVDWSWSPRHSVGLYCWSERLGLSSPSSLFHKTLTYLLETIKCL